MPHLLGKLDTSCDWYSFRRSQVRTSVRPHIFHRDLPLVGFVEQGNEGIFFRRTRQLMSKIKGKQGPHNSSDTDLRKIQTPENMEKIFKQTCLFSCIKSFLKVH